MARLIVRAFKCHGYCYPHVILFRGSRIQPPSIHVAGGKDSAYADTTLDYRYSPANVYVVAMVEQEWAEGSWARVLDFWATYWDRFTTPRGRVACATLALIAGGAIDTDELLSVNPLDPLYREGGEGQLMNFSGDGGHYRARFVQCP